MVRICENVYMPATAERMLTVPHNLAGNWVILQEIQQKYLKTVFSRIVARGIIHILDSLGAVI